MSQLFHIQKNKEFLIKRSEIIQAIRGFFVEQQFIEIDSPSIIRLPGQEPYLDPMVVDVINEKNISHTYFLHTSPEYVMKKVLGAGFEKIFSLGHVFRNKESFGEIHNPEFTMLEWYRKEKTFVDIMDDCENLLLYILKNVNELNFSFKKIRRVHMRDLFLERLQINLDEYLTIKGMQQLCKKFGYTYSEADAFEDLFFKVFLNEIENKLSDEPIIIHHYPVQMAALAKVDTTDPKYAERFELYINEIEIANAFSELCDSNEQKKRFEEEQIKRKSLNKEVFEIDAVLLEALDQITSAAGIALGVDRLVQILLGCKNIEDVLVLPMSKLISN